MATAARLARRALLRLLISRLLALGLGINLKPRLSRLLFASRRLNGLLVLGGRNRLALLLMLYGIRASRKTAAGTTRTWSLLGRLFNIVCNLRRLFNLTHGILLCSLKVSTATALGLLGLHGLLLLRGLLRLGSNLGLNSLGIRLALLSNGATEALLLGAALRIALATPTKTAASCLGRKGTHDVLIEQLIGIDMLTRSSFFHSRHVSGILDDKILDGLGRLLLGIADLGIDGIERRAPVNAATLDLGHDICRDKLIAHRLGVTFLIDGTENLRQRTRLNLKRLAAEQVVGNQLGTLGRKRRLAAQTFSQGIDIILVIGIYRLGHGAPFICTHIRLYGTTRALIHAKHLREHSGVARFRMKKRPSPRSRGPDLSESYGWNG